LHGPIVPGSLRQSLGSARAQIWLISVPRDTLVPSQRGVDLTIENLRTHHIIDLPIGLQLVRFEETGVAGSDRDHRDRCSRGFPYLRRWIANRTRNGGQRSSASPRRRGGRPQSGNTYGGQGRLSGGHLCRPQRTPCSHRLVRLNSVAPPSPTLRIHAVAFSCAVYLSPCSCALLYAGRSVIRAM
jgi:hypothetical protein